MRKLTLLLFALTLFAPAYAADGMVDFRNGLQSFQSNGADALLRAWYDAKSDSAKITKHRERLIDITRPLGPVVATEVFTPLDLGSHVQRLYGVIYFEKRPLWIKAEYYEINGRRGFIALDFSLAAEDILPLERDKFRD
ncbi:MAG: hypothetical protein R3F03_14735 [Opitutaceae bacterium]